MEGDDAKRGALGLCTCRSREQGQMEAESEDAMTHVGSGHGSAPNSDRS